eukprot:39909_1
MEGFKGWTLGIIPGITFAMITYPIFYVVYDKLRSNYGCNPMIAGSTAAVLSWPIGLPFDTMRVRLQCNTERLSVKQVAYAMYKQPIKLWFVGLNATVIRAAPRYAICMWSIEQSNYYLNSTNISDYFNDVYNFLRFAS